MKDQLRITRTNRKLLEKILTEFSLDQLNVIPEGFSNTILWNVAHVMVTQQLLVYKLSGVSMLIDDEMVNRYKKGSKTEEAASQEEVDKIKNLLSSTIDKTEKDMEAGIFKNFNEYPTSTGFVLKSINDAVNFNNFHEGIHLGYIMAMKKSIISNL